MIAVGVLVAAVGFPLLLAAQATAPGPTSSMRSPAGPASTPIASPQQGQLELDKLNAETQKLREEIYALRVTNEAIDPISKWAFGLLTAAGGLVGACFAAFLVFVADRRLKTSQQARLEQERDLEREKQSLALYNGLGDGSFRTRIASASVLLQRLSAYRDRPRSAEDSWSTKDREVPTIVNVLVSLLKEAPAQMARAEVAGDTARGLEPLSTRSTRELSKYVADNLVKGLGAVEEKGIGSASPLTPYDFQKIALDDVYWRWIDARAVDFFGASLTNSGLRNARLAKAVFFQADLSGTTFQDADLSDTDLRFANLSGTDLRRADLSGAKLEGAQLENAKLAGATYDEDTRWPDDTFDPAARGLVFSRAAHYANIMLRAYESGHVTQKELQRFAENRAGRVDGLRDHALRTIGYVEARTNLLFDKNGVSRAQHHHAARRSDSQPRPIDIFTATFGKPRLAAHAQDLMEATRAQCSGGVARMLSPAGAALLARRCKELRPSVSVDLGTYTGLSTLTVAASTDDDARVWTCDIDREAAGLAQTFWERAQLAYKIQLRVESAAEFLAHLLQTLGESSVDLVILDANFDQYAEYLSRISTLLKPGGFLLVDDPSWWGLEELVMLEGDGGTRRLKEFFDAFRANPEYDVLKEPRGAELLVLRHRLRAAAAPAPASTTG